VSVLLQRRTAHKFPFFLRAHSASINHETSHPESPTAVAAAEVRNLPPSHEDILKFYSRTVVSYCWKLPERERERERERGIHLTVIPVLADVAMCSSKTESQQHFISLLLTVDFRS